jgi:hypothetical protein
MAHEDRGSGTDHHEEEAHEHRAVKDPRRAHDIPQLNARLATQRRSK